jgi:hypothetical protein
LLDNGYSVGTSIRGSVKRVEVPYTTKSGETITVKKITKFTEFEGFDFVLYPSYVLTQAKKENIAESINLYLPKSTTPDTATVICELSNGKFCSSMCLDTVKVQESAGVISFDNLMEKLEQSVKSESSSTTFQLTAKEFDEISNKKEDITMSKEMLEALELKKAKLELEIAKLESELEKLKKEHSEYSEKIQEQAQKLSQEESVLEFLSQKKKEVEQLEKVVEQLNTQKEELETKIKELSEKINEASSSGLRVECCGKVFTENNPPKLRVVPVEEAVSNRRWGEIDHDITRKLVYLAGDEKIAKEVFGIVHWNEGWYGLKYPVYEHRKSTEEGYDVDLVLNLNGLRTALIFLLGRPGMALTKKEKKQLVEFLLKKYQMLKEAGIIEEIPEVLLRLAKTLKVAESIEVVANDEIAKALIETAFEIGIVEPELDEDVEESIKVEIDPEIFLTNYAVAVAKTLEGETIESVIEQANQGKYNPNGTNRPRTYEEALERLFNLLVDTQIAQALNIETIEDLDSYIKETIESFKNGEILEGLKRIQVLVDGIGRGSLVLATFIFGADKMIEQEGSVPEAEEAEEGEGGSQSEKPEQNATPTNTQQIQQMAGESETSQNVAESTSTINFDEKIVSETRKELNEISNKKEEDVNRETFIALKKILESNFDVEINSEEDLVKVVENITKDYTDVYFAYEELVGELNARDVLLKLKEEGIEVDEKTKEHIFAVANDPEELKKVVSELISSQSFEESEKVQEQGKGYSHIDANSVIGKDDKLSRILSDI